MADINPALELCRTCGGSRWDPRETQSGPPHPCPDCRAHPGYARQAALPADTRFVGHLRDLQWLCGQIAPDVRGYLAAPEKLGALADALAATQDDLRAYVQRRLAAGVIDVDGETESR